jgi:hypothetical protein
MWPTNLLVTCHVGHRTKRGERPSPGSRPCYSSEAVGPVAFDPDEGEVVVGNQSLCERSSPAVILGRAMRRLAQKNESGITDRCPRSGSRLASSVSGGARSRISEGVMAAPVRVVRVSCSAPLPEFAPPSGSCRHRLSPFKLTCSRSARTSALLDVEISAGCQLGEGSCIGSQPKPLGRLQRTFVGERKEL